MENKLLWQTKLAARLHDPVEKALILMRTVEGHERGTSQVLREQLGLTDLPKEVHKAVKRADHWASAADRAAFPNRNSDGKYPAWQNVRFHEQPVIIHPLTGEEFKLDKLSDVEPEQAKAITLNHFKGLIHDGDLERTALAFWRFGPEIDADEIKSLWAQLPADTRVPDHTIHDHLDLTTALASCFVDDRQGGPALLAVSLGPVQEFIATARTTSDLWAGSHLLSRIAWEAMKVICEQLGPEAILFPRLRGVPQVDLWLHDECKLDPHLFRHCEWKKRRSDANPLFAAALPNRFTALVPASQARELAEAITERVRTWVMEQGKKSFQLLLDTTSSNDSPELPGYDQLREQLAGFPEVHWATVPWSLVASDAEGKVNASSTRLAEAMQPFFTSSPPGYLGSKTWQLLSRGIQLEQGWFWKANPGTLYPALHELLERVLAASKAVRPFAQIHQKGWRDSLSGAAEWLTTDRAQLELPPGQRTDTLWSQVAKLRPAWAKKGEHLSALNTLKRLWPTLFVKELEASLDMDINRFVVSTHTMAMATSLVKAIQDNRPVPDNLRDAVRASRAERVSLPRKLAEELGPHPEWKTLAAIPGWLEAIRDEGSEEETGRAERLLETFLGVKPESYYALALMDGDRMGAWLSAAAEVTRPHQESFHPQVRASLEGFKGDPNFKAYAGESRAPSPSRHMAISEALNNFALTLAPDVVESQHYGRVLYAGGDDLMAMLPVRDLLPAMASLRGAWSGSDPKEAGAPDSTAGFQRKGNGFVYHHKRLLRLMGEQATASCGAVIAHHQAPLSAVLRELRVAEQRAKEEGGRDAFSLSVVKRSGGALYLTAKWGEPIRLLIRLRNFLADPDVSRRAVYNSSLWLRDLPEPQGDGEMAAKLLTFQFTRQGGKMTAKHHGVDNLASGLVEQAIAHAEPDQRISWIENFLSVAEFLARETRGPAVNRQITGKEDAA